MSEIGRLYINAKIYPKIFRNIAFTTHEEVMKFDELAEEAFNAEKQLELIKILIQQMDFSWSLMSDKNGTFYSFYIGYEHFSGDFKEFSEALAGIINDIWDTLTEKEQKRIKDILAI